MKIFLTISIIINILFFAYYGSIIYKKGGIEYLKIKLNITKRAKHSELYYTRMSIHNIMPKSSHDIIFLGNSITDFCEWSELLNNKNIKNRGISGDNIEGLIYRLNDILISKPNKIFLLIGTNDLAKNYSIDQILTNYKKMIDLIKNRSPDTRIYIESILPTYPYKDAGRPNNKGIIALNKELQALTKKYDLIYVNFFDLLCTKNKQLDPMYSNDGLHLNGKGYMAIKSTLEKHVNE